MFARIKKVIFFLFYFSTSSVVAGMQRNAPEFNYKNYPMLFISLGLSPSDTINDYCNRVKYGQRPTKITYYCPALTLAVLSDLTEKVNNLNKSSTFYFYLFHIVAKYESYKDELEKKYPYFKVSINSLQDNLSETEWFLDNPSEFSIKNFDKMLSLTAKNPSEVRKSILKAINIIFNERYDELCYKLFGKDSMKCN